MNQPFLENKKLQRVFEKIWTDPEGALDDLNEVTAGSKKTALTPLTADAQLLHFLLDILLQRFEGIDLQQEKLLAYFTATKSNEKAALLEAWQIYSYTVTGDMAVADKIRLAFTATYTPEQSPLAFACYYVFCCTYSDKNGYFEEHVQLSHEVENILTKHSYEISWEQSLLWMAKLFRARAYATYHRFEETQQILAETQQAIEQHQLCTILHMQVAVVQSVFYEEAGKRGQAIDIMEKLVELLSKCKYYKVAYYTTISNLINFYNLSNGRITDKNSAAYMSNRQKQTNYVTVAGDIVEQSFITASSAFFYYAKAGYLEQENRPHEALQAIAKSIRIFYRLNHVRYLAQAFKVAYQIYKNAAVARADYRMAIKAARSSDRMRTMTDAYYKELLRKRIESVELKFKIKEKELNETLLQQQIDAMSKEVQLTTLNLHEKIQVLDEIKTYVNSLKRKELETRQLINTIAKKIDSVKITEEDKAMLQQKISITNQHLNAILAEKHPSLSNLEIRMCGLFQTGMTNKELAKLYGQSEKSYEQHRYRIKKKMGLANEDKLVSHLLKLSTGK